MIKKVIKDGYTIEYPDTVNYSEDEIQEMIDKSIKLVKHKEAKDSCKQEDSPEPRLVNAEGKLIEKGDEVVDFRGNKAIVKGWQAPSFEGKSGRIYVEELLEEGKKFEAGYYPEVYGLKWKGLPWDKEDVEDIKVEDDNWKWFIIIDDLGRHIEMKARSEEEARKRFEENLSRVETDWPNAFVKAYIKSIEEKKVEDGCVKDVPVNAPEENISITYTEKLKGGKNALTYGMIEEAFKQRAKDDGKTFAAYLDVAIESLKDDIANAKYIVSGEMKSTRNLLLEDYVKIEHLAQKAGLTDKVAEMKPLIDELSEKLSLNYFKQPKFKKSEMKSAARELRNKHRWDSKIEKSLKPVFLCSKSDLTASYNDAKQGKLPQVFEGNLKKVEKDMEADYDRINQGRDHYLEDPRVVKLLPEIIDLYELATKYAEDLGYKDIATRFAYMLTTIKKGWALD